MSIPKLSQFWIIHNQFECVRVRARIGGVGVGVDLSQSCPVESMQQVNPGTHLTLVIRMRRRLQEGYYLPKRARCQSLLLWWTLTLIPNLLIPRLLRKSGIRRYSRRKLVQLKLLAKTLSGASECT